jgi:twitching motility protein PilT
MQDLFRRTVDLGGSDLHVIAGSYPSVRVEGNLHALQEFGKLTGDKIELFVHELVGEHRYKELQQARELDALITNALGYFRANFYYTKGVVSCAFRAIPSNIPSLEALGSPAVLKELSSKKQGLILVTGSTGSGKSTTIAAMIEHINQTTQKHIITIEDPVEFVYEPKESIFSQRSIGSDSRSFQNALRAALREDPDIIVVGEMRDPETMELALSAAETGHLVFATLHTNSAPDTIERIVNSFDGARAASIRTTLSRALLGVISQALAPDQRSGKRVGVYEIMLGTTAVANLIREGKTHQLLSTIQLGRGSGMQLMDDELIRLYKSGVVAKEVLLEFAHNPAEIKKRIV